MNLVTLKTKYKLLQCTAGVIAITGVAMGSAFACSYDDAGEGGKNLFVSSSGSDVGACGLSKTTACASINRAVARAQEENLWTNTTIHVAPGTYSESVRVGQAFDGLTIQGSGRSGVCRSLVLPQNDTGFEAPPGVPVSYGFLVLPAVNTTISGFAVEFTETNVDELDREVGVFLARPARNTTVSHSAFMRATDDERAGPGSRGIFSIQGGGHTFHHNLIACDGDGAFEDGIHIPDHDVNVQHNTVCKANRIGMVSIQETATSDSTTNNFHQNSVDSVPTGIEIQGDDNKVVNNNIGSNVGAPIVICGDGCTCHYVPSNPEGSGDRVADSTKIIGAVADDVLDCGSNTRF